MRSRLALGTFAIAATVIGSGTAFAQECKTREQVKAELVEALRTDTILSGDGTPWRDLGAPLPPAEAALVGKTREQVKAELAEAIRTDTILSGDGTLWRDLGAAQRYSDTPLIARTNCSPDTTVMAGIRRSPDAGSAKNSP